MEKQKIPENKIKEDVDAIVSQRNAIRTKQSTFAEEVKDKVDRNELKTRSHEHFPYKAKIEQIEKELSLLSSVSRNSPHAIFFTAHPNTDYESYNTIIPFQTIVEEEGDSFDGNTGIFTAKIPGVYHFSASLMKYDNKNLYFRIFKNDDEICWGYDQDNNDNFNMVTCSATLKLTSGDRVYVKMSDGQLYSGTYSTFTGFLITKS